MAEVYENEMHEEEKHNNELNELMKDLEGWRAALLRLNGLLNWERPYHPLLIVVCTTFIFTLIWYFEPSFLTTLSILGMGACLVDFFVPLIGSMYGPESWTVVQEQQFEQICERIMHAQDHVGNAKDVMCSLKAEKPKVYFFLLMGILGFFAWIGSLVDNLFLTYILINFFALIPGMRQHGIVEKYFRGIGIILKRLVLGKPSKPKKS